MGLPDATTAAMYDILVTGAINMSNENFLHHTFSTTHLPSGTAEHAIATFLDYVGDKPYVFKWGGSDQKVVDAFDDQLRYHAFVTDVGLDILVQALLSPRLVPRYAPSDEHLRIYRDKAKLGDFIRFCARLSLTGTEYLVSTVVKMFINDIDPEMVTAIHEV
jgi:hypothetical protein